MRKAFIVSFALAAFGLHSTAQESISIPDRITGIWASEQVFGPAVRGTLTIEAGDTGWHARIAGFEVPVQENGNEIRFVLPAGQGDFRGHVSTDRKAIVGHWIQPASAIFFQRYATPVDLTAIAKSVWRGEIVPLPEKISFYFSIRKAVGSLIAIVRNPEFGWFNGRYQVEVNHQSVVLTNRAGQLQGTYDDAADTLSFNLINGSAAPVVFTRRSVADATGFFPRAGQREAYAYSQPHRENDGWETASLTQAGLDPKPISALLQSILDADPDDLNAVPVHSILIARHGKLALEEYFYGFAAESTHNMRSAGKTIGPMLVGIARDHGAKVQPSTLLYSVFARYKPFANWDDRKSKMTVENVMTMTPGLACDDNDNNSPGQENTFQSQTQQLDWYKYTLDLPMARDSGGSTAIYCSASLNLTGGVAEEASGKWNADLFYNYVARPLQFGTYHLNLMPTGEVYTGGGAEIRPRDQLKLGQVYLSKGIWNGRRIVSAAWVEQSTATHSRFARPVVETDLNHQYGYGWHIHTFAVNGHEYREYAAEGAGGQMIMVLPELDLVVAVSAGDYRSGNWYRWMLEILPKYIIPAATTSR
jgi:CubicO group peptidase (beta-lactamase class C family)